MAKLNVNFNDVPDQVIPVDPGVYDLEVKSVEVKPTAAGDGTKLVVELEVVNSEGNDGRKIFDHISTKMETKIKRLAKSCGVEVGEDGLETDDLLGAVCNATVQHRTYTDEQSGEERVTASIRDYLIPNEEV